MKEITESFICQDLMCSLSVSLRFLSSVNTLKSKVVLIFKNQNIFTEISSVGFWQSISVDGQRKLD